MPIVLTGIKPTGTLHLGNYLGAVRPALALAAQHPGSRIFIADVHALNQGTHGVVLRTATLDIAAAWIACGLDPEDTLLYRQSDVPEIAGLASLLTPLAPKGLMNRAHAYKAATAVNAALGKDPDEGVNMGLFTYPILMAADILALEADLVPVGSDQVQHLEMTVDLVRAVHRRWGRGLLKEPQALVDPRTALIPGTDGRKMSKSHGNVVPLFADRKALETLVRKVPTDSLPVEAPKDPGSNVLAAWYRCARPDGAEGFEARLREGGWGWGAAKAEVAAVLDEMVGPLRERYRVIRGDEEALNRVLNRGADRARAVARPLLDRVSRAAFGV